MDDWACQMVVKTPPDGGVDGPSSWGSKFVSRGVLHPIRGGWINSWFQSYRHLKFSTQDGRIHDVITDVIRSGSTIRVDH